MAYQDEKKEDYPVQVVPAFTHRSSEEEGDYKGNLGGTGGIDHNGFTNQVPDFDGEKQVTDVAQELAVTSEEYAAAAEYAKGLSLDQVFSIMKGVIKIHENDPNFPLAVIINTREFLAHEDEVRAAPEEWYRLIDEMKLEAALISTSSPYAEVRSTVDNTDDPTLPSSTIRAWFLGILFVVGGSFINQLFSIRQPAISVGSNVAQLLAFPAGKLLEKVLPDVGFNFFGSRLSLNPGKFNRKEHMLITIMANVGFNTPYTDNIIWSQYLPQYFNQPYAGEFSYQILIALGTNFIGYSVAGLTRRFLVYPAHAVWPTSLVTIALNRSFHSDSNVAVQGPFGRIWRASRMKCFYICFGAMFVYFWFPDFIFTAMSTFNWPTWISPENMTLVAITGMNNGLGINPLPTFDWNIVIFNGDPLVLPYFNIMNGFFGMLVLGSPVLLGLWYSNAWNTGYLPMNSNRVYDNTGARYNVSRAIDDRGLFDATKYEAYSPAYMAAGNLTVYFFFFALYAATVSYAWLYHRHEIAVGFRSFNFRWRSLMFWKKRTAEEKADEPKYLDVHNRLMAAYPEVSEWWYFGTLLFSLACALAGISAWETYTTPGVVFYGLALCLIFVIPIGIIRAITGVEVTLNVLAEFIGGAWFPGNALSMNFFKSFGYVTCAHALAFAADMKLAHYVKLPPRHTFFAQMIATLVSSFVCTGVLNFQMNSIEDVCTPDQPAKFTCPGINTFFTAAVFWGTLGPIKVFGAHGPYKWLLFGFPFGFLLPFPFYYLQKKYPNKSMFRNVHVVILLYGPLLFAPYNLSYAWAGVPMSWFSMKYLKTRHLAFWSKYNYVVSASFSSAIAIAGIVIFFALQWTDLYIDWWGNNVSSLGYEGTAPRRLEIPEEGFFGPPPGTFT